MPSSAQDVRATFKRLRILVVVRANAGETTLLQKVCNATRKPEIFDGKENKINTDVVKPSVDPDGHFKPFSIDVMLGDKAKSGGSTKQGKAKGVALVDSPTRVAPLTSAKDPPPYGAQHRQDAFWKGGNEALPPRWHQFKVGGNMYYQDDNLVMSSFKRPLPGMNLDNLSPDANGTSHH
ncbi:hypothetical protein M405DRAFT_867315 [Rhizopogon salebrosus TDB-379]|nr:hypothetical protein M405DRAFT_867315 [Rhizopogon salebrosus TDB-379]